MNELQGSKVKKACNILQILRFEWQQGVVLLLKGLEKRALQDVIAPSYQVTST